MHRQQTYQARVMCIRILLAYVVLLISGLRILLAYKNSSTTFCFKLYFAHALGWKNPDSYFHK